MDECKVCSREIPQSVVNSPDWDGETCSPDCLQELLDLAEDIPWGDIPEDDHELYEEDPT